MIPQYYDYETFRYYLELDVLQDVAKAMEWTDVIPVINEDESLLFVNIHLNKPSGSKTATLTDPLPIELPKGYAIYVGELWDGIHYNPQYLITSTLVAKGSTSFQVEGYLSTAFDVDTKILRPTQAYRDKGDVYTAITNEALLTLGYSTPESVPASKIIQFRLLGRIEAWRAVVYNTVADVDVTIENTSYARSQLNANALTQLQFAEAEYEQMFPFAVPTVPNDVPRSYTSSGKVTVRW